MAKLKTFLMYLAAYLTVLAIATTVLAISSGQWDRWSIWIYAGLISALLTLVDSSFQFSDALPMHNTMTAKGQDYLSAWLFAPMFLVHWVIAGLDIGRFHWSDTIPSVLQIAGFIGLLLAGMFARWAIVTNCFYSGVIRLQAERGHYVVSKGPYQFVRHPAYASLFVIYLSSGLALGSWWAFVPIGLAWLLFIRRIVLEEMFLHEKLQGYTDYAQQVRYRLIPGIW